MKHILSILIIATAIHICSLTAQLPEINTSHIDRLYKEILLEGDSVGIVYIYSEAPDYAWVGDHDEGVACIDDATRAAVFYLHHGVTTGEEEYMRKALMLMRFVLKMQSDNGYFYNFVWGDHSIHKEGITTINNQSWWSWRALWALSVFIENEKYLNPVFTEELRVSQKKLVEKILADGLPSFDHEFVDGIKIPSWLPSGSGADQSALAIMGLTPYFNKTKDERVERYLNGLVAGMLETQLDAPGRWFDDAFLCWQNLWHGYGSSQAYALLEYSQVMENTKARPAALDEVDNFYPKLWSKGWLRSFKVKKRDSGELAAYDVSVFDQIAYAMRPAIWASVEAYEITGEEKYLDRAKELFTWFQGNNKAQFAMYDPQTGRGYDGINSKDAVNKNAGAESTIEALLALQKIQMALEK